MKLEGFFRTIHRANETVKTLKTAGYENAFVDMREPHFANPNTDINYPGTENTPGLSSLVLKSGDPAVEENKAPLTAANPMVSGIGNFEEITDYNCKVVVETESNRIDNAKRIITDMGGKLEDPDIITPERLDKLNISNLPDDVDNI